MVYCIGLSTEIIRLFASTVILFTAYGICRPLVVREEMGRSTCSRFW